MKDYKNINEKLTHDINILGLGISLLKEAVNNQVEIDPEKISNKTKEMISMVHFNLDHLGNTYIPEQIEKDKLNSKESIRDANEKIRELELKLGEKVTPNDISNLNKLLETQFRDAFNSVGLYAAPEIQFNSHSISINIKFIKSLKESSYFSDSQDDMDQLKTKNKEHLNIFKQNFDYRDSKEKDSELPILISEKNIKRIERMLIDHELYFDIDTIHTDRFSKNYDEITTISLNKSLHNIHLKWDRSVYGDND